MLWIKGVFLIMQYWVFMKRLFDVTLKAYGLL